MLCETVFQLSKNSIQNRIKKYETNKLFVMSSTSWTIRACLLKCFSKLISNTLRICQQFVALEIITLTRRRNYLWVLARIANKTAIIVVYVMRHQLRVCLLRVITLAISLILYVTILTFPFHALNINVRINVIANIICLSIEW